MTKKTQITLIKRINTLTVVLVILFEQSVFSVSSSENSIKSKNKKFTFLQALKSEKSCRLAYDKFVPSLKKLASALPNKHAPSKTAIEVIGYKQQACNTTKSRRKFILSLHRILRNHSSKVGILVPPTPNTNQKYIDFIKKGLLAYIGDHNISNESYIVETASPKRTLKSLATLYFDHRVTSIVTFSSINSESIAKFSKDLHIPVLFLGSMDHVLSQSPFIKNIFPSKTSMARELARTAKRMGYESIGILYPNNNSSLPMVNGFISECKKLGINTKERFAYQNTYNSLDTNVKSLLFPIINKEESVETTPDNEVKVKTEDNKAEETTELITTEIVKDIQYTLKVDAVFIPDNFRMAHHIVKIFSYYGITQLPLLGSHKWRSQGLLSPFQPLFEGAIFADYVGSYSAIPKSIYEQHIDDNSFLDGETAEYIDHALIGYNAAKFVHEYKITSRDSRLKVAKFFANDTQQIQSQENNSFWPSHIFQIRNRKFVAIGK